MNVSEKIKSLNLKHGEYIVVGSGILDALCIRASRDIDLVVSEEVYKRFEAAGWQTTQWSDQLALAHDVFDLGRSWEKKDVRQLLKNAQYVDDTPYLSLNDVYAWKKKTHRNKDIKDLDLIDNYFDSL